MMKTETQLISIMKFWVFVFFPPCSDKTPAHFPSMMSISGSATHPVVRFHLNRQRRNAHPKRGWSNAKDDALCLTRNPQYIVMIITIIMLIGMINNNSDDNSDDNNNHDNNHDKQTRHAFDVDP